MNALFKFIFGMTSTILITATVFILTLFIGRAVTGSWNMQEWNCPEIKKQEIIVEYQPKQGALFFDCYKLNV